MSSEARGALAISGGQAALMLSGGVLALLITQFFGKGAGTDAFFTAYGFYVIAVAFAQTLRLTALPRLMGDIEGEQESRLLVAAISLSLAAAVPMLGLAGPLGRLIANGDPTGVAAETLRLLWPALALQIVAGVMTPMLTLRGIYSSVGLAFALTGAISVAAFLLLQPELGIKAVAVSLMISSALLTTSMAATLRRSGWRIQRHPFTDPMTILRDAGSLSASSASFIVFNVGYVISLSVANHGSRGSATVYAYAFFVAAFVVASTAVPSALVRAPRLLDSGGDRGLSTTDVLTDFRLALVPTVPLIGVAVALASPLADLMTGGFFDYDDAQKLSTALLALVPWILAGSVGIMVVLELVNRDRVTRLGWIALAHAVVLVPLAVLGEVTLGIFGIALGQSLAMCVATAIQIWAAFADDSRRLLAALMKEAFIALAIGFVAFLPGWIGGRYIGVGAALALTTSGLALGLFAIRRRYRAEWRLLTAALPGRRSRVSSD